MNNYGDLRKILEHLAMQQAFENAVESLVAGNGISAQSTVRASDLWKSEYDPSIETSITDRDMLLFHIDMALDNGDEVAFDLLVEELEGTK